MSEHKDNLGSSKAWLRPLWLGSLVAASITAWRDSALPYNYGPPGCVVGGTGVGRVETRRRRIRIRYPVARGLKMSG